MELQEIKSMLDEQTKLVNEARKEIENGKADKEKLEKMKVDFIELEKANKELLKKQDEIVKAKEEMNGRLDLLEKQNARFGSVSNEDVEKKEALASFNRFVKEYPVDGRSFIFSDLDKKYLRTDLAADGGVLVPNPVMAEVVKQEIEISPILANARVINSKVKSMNVGVRTTVPSVNRVGEGGTSSSSNSKYSSVRIEAYRNDVIIPISREELNFTEVNMETEMAQDAAIALSYQTNYDFLNGNGVSKSEGIMTSSAVGSMNSGIANDIDLDNFYSIQAKTNIKSVYARTGKFYMNSNTIFNLATRKGGDGHYIWQQNGALGLPTTIAGKPYEDTPDMPDIGAGLYPVLFGDLRKAYYILRAVGMELVVDPYSSKTTGIIEYMWIEFIGGKIALAEAVVKMKCSA